ncbi:prepilin peptidase [Clostridium baratii]|uniref:prepilin peptidase n=1 Tax=Clostridium baratii TaxID=1561 RepID=UPI0030CA9B2A
MELAVVIAIFIFGAIIGSFLNVCIYRIIKEESIAYPPSHCGSCGENLKARDLIPIISYIFLKGRCRYCKEKVSIQYPIVEAITGILFLVIYFKFGFSLELIKYMFFTSILIVIGIIDFKTQDVYTSTIVTGLIGGLIFLVITYLVGNEIHIINTVLAMIIPALILFILYYFGAMGFGDVEIVFFIGLFLNLKLSLLNLFLSIVLGGIVALIMMIYKKTEKGAMMAFGPYISIAAYITIIFGDELIKWYIGTFF